MRTLYSFGLLSVVACTADTNKGVNVAPTITSIVITPQDTITASTELFCLANAVDDNDDRLSLDYQWTNSDGTVIGEYDRLQLTPDIVRPMDELTCTATVDDGMETVTASTSVSIENSPPTLSNLTITPEEVFVDSLLECTFDAADADNEELTISYSWTQNGQEVGTESSLQLDVDGYNAGDVIACRVRVADGYDGTAIDEAEVTIQNSAPSLATVEISPNPANSTDTLSCTTSGISDLEQDDVVIAYEWTVDGTVVSETTNVLSGPFSVSSEIQCSATPNDGELDGASLSDSVSISNSLPSVDSLSLDAGPIYTDGTITASTTVSDPDAEHVPTTTYTWHVIDAVDGTDTVVQTGSSNTLDGTLFDKGDQVYVIATPNDGIEDGAISTSSMLTISNSEPTGLTATLTSTDAFFNDSTLTCSAMASDIDPEDATLNYTYTWSTGDTGADIALDGSLLPGSTVTCSVTATDSSGASISTDISEVLPNRAPSLDSVSLPQNITTETTSILCDAIATDLDGETPSLTYGWTINGAPISETSETLSENLVYGDVIECSVTAADAIETSGTVVASSTVANTPPEITCTLGATYTTVDTLEATVTLLDPDIEQQANTTYSYQWYADGNPVSTSSETLTNPFLNAHFSKNQQVYVEVIANDGVEDGPVCTSSAASIVNSTPVIADVSISPDPAILGTDDLTCSVSASDEDGDSLVFTYEWSDSNGVQYSTQTADTSDTLLTDELSEDTWICSVTADDQDANGTATDSDSAVVESDCVSLSFNGIDESISMNAIAGLESGFTYEAWLNGAPGSNDGYLLSTNCGGVVWTPNGIWTEIYPSCNGTHTRYHNAGSPISIEVPNTWYHLAVTVTDSQTTVFINGEEMGSSSMIDDIGGVTGVYGNGLFARYSNNGLNYYVNTEVHNLRLSIGEVYTTEFVPTVDLASTNDTTLLFDFSDDNASLSNNASIVGGTWVDSCPDSDNDGDGIPTWEDCDDSDASLPSLDDQDCDGILASAGDCDDLNPLVGMDTTGVSADCAAISCNEPATMGYNTGDGFYWIDPDGSGPFEAYCDMTTDDGGWTLVAKIEGGSSSQWTYDSPTWTTTGTEFNDIDFDLTTGEAKYSTFDIVPLTEILLEDPINSNAAQLEAVGTSLLDFLSAQTSNTSANVVSIDYSDDSTITYIGYNPLNICAGNLSAFLNNSDYNYNVNGSYVSGATGLVRIGFWGSGSNAWRWAETSTCGIGLGVKVYGYNGTTESGTTIGDFTLLWVR